MPPPRGARSPRSRRDSFSLASTSGPRPGISFGFASGGLRLLASTSATVSRSSWVVPLNVRRKYGSKWAQVQRGDSASAGWTPVAWNHVPFV